ncbi:glucocorticoid modulatory element-binding protein 1-like [Solea solea]|uniref:glucocorticoid modulatory element-binding protein 1-like n=1 Tax=Solea solea TaxID=90069 RepID=UPI00272A34F3|nr:glucocorticoid modulatory element-binding protein 1-like [Solea solea]
MAGAEVTVSPGELMAVKKEEEGESSDNSHKTQVILHLQPILHGINEDTADTGTTVLAIETHHDDSEADGEKIEYGYPITCGNNRAVLLFKKFVCPGINVRCVTFNEQLISPKQFVHLAGKATLKDWKRAIRLGGVMLRKMMDSGQIDFYQHDTVCSNTCRSTKFDVLINSTRLPPGIAMQPSPSSLALDPPGRHMPLLTEIVHDAAEAEESLGDRVDPTAEGSPGPTRPVTSPTTASGHAAKRKKADTPEGILSLWKGVAHSGLMREVLSSLQTELQATLKGVEVRSENASLQETDAVFLNSLCEMFGLLDSVKEALDLKRSRSEQSKIHDSAHDDISEEWRKLGRDKSSYNGTSSKHLRPQKHSQTQNVLSPVKESPVIHAFSFAGLSAAAYAQLSINPQLFTHFSASSGKHHQTREDRRGRHRKHEISEMESQEKLHQWGQERVEKQETSGIYKDPGQRTGKPCENLHLTIQEEEEKEGLRDFEKVMIGKKSSKKNKSK